LVAAALIGLSSAPAHAEEDFIAPRVQKFQPAPQDTTHAVRDKKFLRRQSLNQRATGARSLAALDTIRGLSPEERTAMRLRYKILHPLEP
jgi:hypothetical protein